MMRGALSCPVLVAREVGLVILGIDPGLAHTGWGLSRSGVARSAVVPTVVSRPVPEVRSRCACRISPMTFKDVVERYRPDTAAVESIYFGANVRSAIPTAHARGAALCGAFGVRARDWRVHAHASNRLWWAPAPRTSGRSPTWYAR